MKIYIGVGHGGRDSGAYANGIKEKDINLIVAKSTRDILEQHGVQVLMSRNDDFYESVQEKVNECNSFNPDFCIEIHFNAGGGDGFEGFVYPNTIESIGIGKIIERELAKNGQNSRGLKDGSKFGMVRETHAPALLVEGGFIDSKKDLQAFDELHEQKKFGEIYAMAILEYFKIPLKKPVPESELLYCVQVGAYALKENAEKKAQEMEELGINSFIWVK